MTNLFANAMCIVLRYDRRSESKRKNTIFGQTVLISSCKPNSTRCGHSEHGISSEEKIALTVKKYHCLETKAVATADCDRSKIKDRTCPTRPSYWQGFVQ